MLDIYYMIANFGNFELSPYDFNFSRREYQLKKRVSLRTLAIQLISEYIYILFLDIYHTKYLPIISFLETSVLMISRREYQSRKRVSCKENLT